MNKVGSRLQVMRGTAKQTSGGLSKKDLQYNKYGKIVSKKKSKLSKLNHTGRFSANNARNLNGGNNNQSSSGNNNQLSTENIIKQGKQATLRTVYVGGKAYTQLITGTGAVLETAVKMTGTVANIANKSLQASSDGIVDTVGQLSSTLGSAAGVVSSATQIIKTAVKGTANTVTEYQKRQQIAQNTKTEEKEINEKKKRDAAQRGYKENKLSANIAFEQKLRKIRNTENVANKAKNNITRKIDSLNNHIEKITLELENEIENIIRNWWNIRGKKKLDNIKNTLNTFKSFVILLISNSSVTPDVRDTIVISYSLRINVLLKLVPGAKDKRSGALETILKTIKKEYDSMARLYNNMYNLDLKPASLNTETHSNTVGNNKGNIQNPNSN